jgi:hypothetical protein
VNYELLLLTWLSIENDIPSFFKLMYSFSTEKKHFMPFVNFNLAPCNMCLNAHFERHF